MNVLLILHLSHATQAILEKQKVAGGSIMSQLRLFLRDCNASLRLFPLKLAEGRQRPRLDKHS